MSLRVSSWLRIVTFTALAGCSGSPDKPPMGGNDETRVVTNPTPSDDGDGGQVRCVPFETRECVIDLGVVNGVHNCAKGKQVCEEGAWSSCTESTL